MTDAWPEDIAARYHTVGGYIVDITIDGQIGRVTVDDEQAGSADDCYIEATADRILNALAK